MTAPQKSECPVGAGQIADQSSRQIAILASVPDAGKQLASLKASLALGGHAVHELATGGYLVIATQWGGMSRECPDLTALAAFARQIGART